MSEDDQHVYCRLCLKEIQPDDMTRMSEEGQAHADCADYDEGGWSLGPDGWEP